MSKQIHVNKLASTLDSVIDVFICSASFEERSTIIPLGLNTEKVKVAYVFRDPIKTGGLGQDSADKITSHFGGKAQYIEISLSDPLSIADAMVATLSRKEEDAFRILVDVTTFTHEALLILLKVLQLTCNPNDKITGVYNGASEYGVGLTADEKWLTRGVSEIRSVLGYPGETQPMQSRHLIVLAGFEVDRAEEVITACEPTVLSIGFGGPLQSISSSHHSLNRGFYEKIIANHSNARGFEFSCDDVEKAKETILEQAAYLSGFNTVIAPMNTKISTIGVALAAMDREEMQLCYAVPEVYNLKEYSTPSSQAYIFDIVLPPL